MINCFLVRFFSFYSPPYQGGAGGESFLAFLIIDSLFKEAELLVLLLLKEL